MIFPEKPKTLMNKFNLSIDQLDYKYIENCQSVKQLERILRVLRSGEEGTYPHLLKFCENKLRDKDPLNKLLIVAEKAKHYAELSDSEKKEILADMEQWSHEMSQYKTKSTATESVTKEIPPIRNQNRRMTLNSNKSDVTLDSKVLKVKECKPRSYEDWDKYNVDEELNKLDDKGEEEIDDIKEDTTMGLSKHVPITNLLQPEREKIAELERMKGNEAYKAQDYKEAEIYYTRSLSAYKTAKSLNNRAQTYIKLKRYLEAVLDCNEAISMEPSNVKALFRRGIAHKEAKIYDLAIIDFGILLEIEPNNVPAKEQLQEIEKLRLQTPENRKVLIEEIETNDQPQETNFESKTKTMENNSSKRIMIEEIKNTTIHQPTLDEICNCNNDTYPALSKTTQEMFNIVQNQKLEKPAPEPKMYPILEDRSDSNEMLVPVSSKYFYNDKKLEPHSTKSFNK
ncbi:hypothetical protein JTE90_028156 [Oedothorax gibbosus]|uniref:Sperm-associated antigen 1 n=1 Tax=Oedothorax gibbosus TaxID=931172 RepID=A0AAV6VAQ6_9ARAC|nr:hypothetical protein JTE90_028156 [Oedothorax gibbosus]